MITMLLSTQICIELRFELIHTQLDLPEILIMHSKLALSTENHWVGYLNKV